MSELEYYEQLEDLFVHPGWSLFVKQIQEAHDIETRTVENLKTVEDLYRYKGKMLIYRLVLNFQQISKANAKRLREVDEHVDTL